MAPSIDTTDQWTSPCTYRNRTVVRVWLELFLLKIEPQRLENGESSCFHARRATQR